MSTVWTLPGQNVTAVSTQTECFLFVMGPVGSGKTSLIAKILSKEIGTKSSLVLDYNYSIIRKPDTLEDWTVHAWEVGSGTKLISLVGSLLNPERTNLLIFVVDLSKPHQIWETLETCIREVTLIIEELLKENPQLKSDLVERARRRVGSDHKDISQIQPLLVPGVVVPTKFDILRKSDPMTAKIVGKTLRYLAHSNGLALLYCNNMTESVPSRSQVKSLLFTGGLREPYCRDHDSLMAINFGGDCLADIGQPIRNDKDRNLQRATTESELWKNSIESFFPPEKDSAEKKPNPLEDPKYQERVIDQLLASKMEGELEGERH